MAENTTKIPLNSRAKRPQFFDDQGVDSIVTMTTELMTELWVLKERVFVLEKVLDESGMNVRQQIESVQLSQEDVDKLESTRRRFVETIMRAFDSGSVDRASAQREIDDLTDSMKKADLTEERG